MEIKEIKKLKEETERKIMSLIDNFNHRTECIITEISFTVENRQEILCVDGVKLQVLVPMI
jgi:hypothetical protein